MEIDSNCYSFKRLEVTEGLFDSSVDATYVITLEGNGRYESIEAQLKTYHPTKELYIMTNRGYKRCKKNLKMDLPRYDLTDAFINIFRHANAAGYKNVLVLEDDFIFNDKIFDTTILSTVNSFVSARTDTSFIYLLGCLPQLQIPYDWNHNIPVQSGGTHAVIYSRSYRDKAIRDYKETTIDDWDEYCKQRWNRYTYKEPLIYQLFPMTENRQNWAAPDYILYLADLVLRFHKLDINVEPGYSRFYLWSKISFYLLIVFFVVLLWFLIFYLPFTKTAARAVKYVKRTTGF
jgi:hypothetical protein